MELTGKDLPVENDNFKLQMLIDANLQDYRDEISDICESADKQLVIPSPATHAISIRILESGRVRHLVWATIELTEVSY